MSGRPNWYSDHPPACTCAACRGTGRSRRGRRGEPQERHIRHLLQRWRTAAPIWRRGFPAGIPAETCGQGRREVGGDRGVCGMCLWFLRNDDTRAEVLDWISTQTDVVADRVRRVSDSMESRTSLRRFEPYPRPWPGPLPLRGRFVDRPSRPPRVRLNPPYQGTWTRHSDTGRGPAGCGRCRGVDPALHQR